MRTLPPVSINIATCLNDFREESYNNCLKLVKLVPNHQGGNIASFFYEMCTILVPKLDITQKNKATDQPHE